MSRQPTYCYSYPRPAVTVDCVVFGVDLEEGDLKVLLIERGTEPFSGSWALPGGHVLENEDLEPAARRELLEEAGLEEVFLEQLYTLGGPGRDPRGHYVTVCYYALVNLQDHRVRAAAGSDARDAAWFAVTDLPELAFDHRRILEIALDRLKGKVCYQPIGFELLPPAFTLSQLQQLYEILLERRIDKRNFRKKALKLGILADTREIQKDVAHRAARLYRFDRGRYLEMEQDGFNFQL